MKLTQGFLPTPLILRRRQRGGRQVSTTGTVSGSKQQDKAAGGWQGLGEGKGHWAASKNYGTTAAGRRTHSEGRL